MSYAYRESTRDAFVALLRDIEAHGGKRYNRGSIFAVRATAVLRAIESDEERSHMDGAA